MSDRSLWPIRYSGFSRTTWWQLHPLTLSKTYLKPIRLVWHISRVSAVTVLFSVLSLDVSMSIIVQRWEYAIPFLLYILLRASSCKWPLRVDEPFIGLPFVRPLIRFCVRPSVRPPAYLSILPSNCPSISPPVDPHVRPLSNDQGHDHAYFDCEYLADGDRMSDRTNIATAST